MQRNHEVVRHRRSNGPNGHPRHRFGWWDRSSDSKPPTITKQLIFRQLHHPGQRHRLPGVLPAPSRSHDLGPKRGRIRPGTVPAGGRRPTASVRVPTLQRRSPDVFGRAIRVARDEGHAGTRTATVPAEKFPHHGHHRAGLLVYDAGQAGLPDQL